VDQKLLLRTTRNNQINDINSCKILESAIGTKFGWTYGKFEINASIEQNNAIAFITLSPIDEIYGSGKRSGYIDVFVHENAYVKQRSNQARVGIRYGDDSKKYYHLTENELSQIKTDFHVFVFEWNRKEMIWKIDGNIIFSLSLTNYFLISDKEGKYAEKGQPFDHDFYIIFSNHFYLKTIYEDIDKNFTDSKFIIDYFKYYELKQNESISLKPTEENKYFMSTNNNLVLIIVIVGLIMILIFSITCGLFLYYKIRQRNENLTNSRVKDKIEIQLENDYDQIELHDY